MRSAFAAASSSCAPRSIAPRRRPPAMAFSELTPRISPSKPDLLSASPNDPPISPTPTMATVRNSDSPSHGRGDDAKLIHQLGELVREQGLRAVAQRVVGIVVHFNQQPVGAGRYRRARHGGHLVAPA